MSVDESKAPFTAQLAKEAMKSVRRVRRQDRVQVVGQSSSSSPLIPASVLLENVAKIREVLPCLSEEEGAAMLSVGGRNAMGTSARKLVARIVPFLDENWPLVKDQVYLVHYSSGAFGQRVLRESLDGVNKLRRKRGAAEVARIDALLQVREFERQRAAAAGEDVESADKALEMDEPMVQLLLKAYAAELREERGGLVLGELTKADLVYLREIRQELMFERRYADLREVRAADYYGAVFQLLERSRERGYGPRTARRRREMLKERKKHPNVLFEPIDGKGGNKWGGVVPDVKRVGVAYEAVSKGQVELKERRLTPEGERLFREFKQQLPLRFGMPTPGNGAGMMAADRAVQAKLEELLSQDREGVNPAQWTWVEQETLHDLGFEYVEKETVVSGPDDGIDDGFGVASVVEVIEYFRQHEIEKLMKAEKDN